MHYNYISKLDIELYNVNKYNYLNTKWFANKTQGTNSIEYVSNLKAASFNYIPFNLIINILCVSIKLLLLIFMFLIFCSRNNNNFTIYYC
jgi:hypothetical protein